MKYDQDHPNDLANMLTNFLAGRELDEDEKENKNDKSRSKDRLLEG